MTKTQEVRFIP